MTRSPREQTPISVRRWDDHEAAGGCDTCGAGNVPICAWGDAYICKGCWALLANPLGSAVVLVALREQLALLAERVAALERRAGR